MGTLYNHYIPKDMVYQRIPWEPQEEPRRSSFGSAFSGSLGSLFGFGEKGEKNAGLSGILKKFKLEDIDLGDLLLLAILVLVLLEGDNWELAIILGLVLFLSFTSEDGV